LNAAFCDVVVDVEVDVLGFTCGLELFEPQPAAASSTTAAVRSGNGVCLRRSPCKGWEVLDSRTKTLSDSTDAPLHAAIAAVLRARGTQLEVLVGDGRLPGALIGPREPLEAALTRAVDVAALAHLEQLETRSDPRRAPGRWELATAYLGLLPADRMLAGTWHPITALPRLADDHAEIASAAHSRLRAKLSYTNIGFALAPETFTMSELREIYVAALGHDVSTTNLQRVLVRRGVLARVGGRRAPGRAGGRPAALFRFVSQELEITDEFAALRPPR
jgi:8-oxo-dGTP diphosphatase